MQLARFAAVGAFVSLLLTIGGCSPVVEQKAAAKITPASAPELTDDAALNKRLDDTIEFTRARHMTSEDHNAWQIVHGILAYGRDLEIKVDGKLVSALDYLVQGGEIRGWTMRPGDHGLEAVLEPGTKIGQGHEDQWIGYLSQCGLAPDDAIVVKGQTFKLSDLLTQAQWDIHPGMEASWTLMALSTYLPPGATWKSKDGAEWTVEKIAEMEAGQNLLESPCGGTHRLYGLAMALNLHLAQGGKLTGGWAAADKKVKESVTTALKYQQADGNFSVAFFERPATSPDIATVLHATGHTFEFLVMSADEKQLHDPALRRGAVAMCQLLDETRDMDVECGALYHAAHGLLLYRDRLFGQPQVAQQPPAATEAAGAAEK